MISISDTLESNNYLTNQHLRSDNYYLEILQDTISFQHRYYSSSENYNKLHILKYDMKIVEQNDSILIIKPIGDHTKRFFQKSEPIKFVKRDYIKNEHFLFEKLIFHTSECFGTCPVIDLEISNTRSVRLNIKSYPYYKAENSASFSGELSDKLYKELIHLLIISKISDLNMNPDPRMLCCDGAIKTLIGQFNNLMQQVLIFRFVVLWKNPAPVYAMKRGL